MVGSRFRGLRKRVDVARNTLGGYVAERFDLRYFVLATILESRERKGKCGGLGRTMSVHYPMLSSLRNGE